jgi:hypothetical protein
MRRIVVTLMLLACFQFLNPTPAHAWWRFIDELSGPGGFNGVDLQWRLVCFADKKNPSPFEIDSALARFGAGVAALLESGCVFQPGVVPRTSINLEAGRLSTHKNNLQRLDALKPVSLRILEPTVTFNLDPKVRRDFIEIGAGAGVVFLRGPAFDSFTRVIIDPLRVDIRPFAFMEQPHLQGIVARILVTVFPQAFEAANFGSTEPYHRKGEVRVSLGATYDLRSPLLR